MEGESDKKRSSKVRTVERTIGGRKFVFEGIKYKDLKIMKKTAGEDAQMLNDMVMMACIREPQIGPAELDEMEVGDIIQIQKAVAEVTGIDANMVKGF
jgi:hypothetical protein